MKILILCTGNSCRSQMAHGFLQSFDPAITVASAGTQPAAKINDDAVKVMREEGIDISSHKPENVSKYLYEPWDFVITVCDDANETCPVFTGVVKHRLHIGFEDPSKVKGDPEHVYNEFIRIRDSIKNSFYKLYVEQIRPNIP